MGPCCPSRLSWEGLVEEDGGGAEHIGHQRGNAVVLMRNILGNIPDITETLDTEETALRSLGRPVNLGHLGKKWRWNDVIELSKCDTLP